MTKGNCLLYAVKQYISHGGYIAMRRGRLPFIPHFIWIESIDGAKWSEFKPPDKVPIYKLLRFNGMVVEHPSEEHK